MDYNIQIKSTPSSQATDSTVEVFICDRCEMLINNGVTLYSKDENKYICSWCITKHELFGNKQTTMCQINKLINRENNNLTYKCLYCENLNHKFNTIIKNIQKLSSMDENPCTFTLDITYSNTFGMLISAFGSLFLYSAKVCFESDRIHHSVQNLADFEYSYMFDVTLRKNNTVQTCTGYVTHIALDNKVDSLMSINNLIQTMDGGTDIEFSVTIHQDDLKDLPSFQTFDIKSLCIYVCKNSSRCTYKDTLVKLEKHQLLFCPFANNCQFCLTDMSQSIDILQLHYESNHNDITYNVGLAWKASTEPFLGGFGGKCLLNTTVGLAVCTYRLHKDVFKFAVYTSLISKDISKYYCEIILKDPANSSGEVGHIFRLSEKLNNIFDWSIEICNFKENVFKYQCNELEIVVSIVKNERSN